MGSTLISGDIFYPDEMVTFWNFFEDSSHPRDLRWEPMMRLTFGCGLRFVECSGLDMGSVKAMVPRPHIVILGQKGKTKGKNGKYRGRLVPLYWDSGTLDAIRRHYERRRAAGAKDSDPFILTPTGKRMSDVAFTNIVSSVRRLYERCFGPDRVAKGMATHIGRHTFASTAVYRGKTIVEVSKALGHANVATTSEYLTVIETDHVEDLYPRPFRIRPNQTYFPPPEESAAELDETAIALAPWTAKAKVWIVPPGSQRRQYVPSHTPVIPENAPV